jgi:hypothetical protein
MLRYTMLMLCACLSLAMGCRQILGLQRAHLSDAGGAGSAASGTPSDRASQSDQGVPTPGFACEAPILPACSDCRKAQCQGYDSECAADPKCRHELDKYALCLGPSCKGDPEICAMKATASTSDLRYCLDHCSECNKTPLLSPCELYCACMDECPEDLRVADCLTTCKNTLSASVRNCRRDHCERAIGQSDLAMVRMHCEHANGSMPVCVDAEPSHVCLDKDESTWSCEVPSQCCSGSCINGACE